MLKSALAYPVSLMRANKYLTVPVVETSPPVELTGGGGGYASLEISGAVVTNGGGDGGGLGDPAGMSNGGGDGGGGDGVGVGVGAGVEPGVGFVDTGTLDIAVQAPL
jgi:hypothetical protein